MGLKILGLIASYRKHGNSEVLVRVALSAARDLGADVELMRLTDLDIRPCKGCMACIFKGERCAIKDDMPRLIDAIVEADGLIVGAPVYILSAPGIVKMATDRLIELMHPDRLTAITARRRASGILIAATEPERWAGLALPLLKIFCYAALAPPVDWAIAAAAGPGEVVLDEAALRAARRVGRNVVRAIRGDTLELPARERVCPVCGGRLLEIRGGTRALCPLCGIEGELAIEDGRLTFKVSREEFARARWTRENMLKHVEETIMPTRDRYLAKREEIKKALKALFG